MQETKDSQGLGNPFGAGWFHKACGISLVKKGEQACKYRLGFKIKPNFFGGKRCGSALLWCEVCLAKGVRIKFFTVHHFKAKVAMQRIRLFLILSFTISILIIYACRENFFEESVSNTEMALSKGAELRRHLSELSRRDQIIQYNKLSPSQKCDVWRNKISQVLQTELSNQQRLIVQDIYEHISPAFFDIDESQLLSDNFIEDWSVEAVRVFAPHQINMMFGRIEDYVPSTKNSKSVSDRNNGGSTPEPPGPDCHCKGTLINSCEFYWMECVSGVENCNPKPRGCGFLWQQPCSGRCVDR